MTFFYDLNKKLQGVLEQPKSVHQNLNESAAPVQEGIGDAVKKVGSMAKKLGQKAITTLGHGDDAEMMRDLQRKMGVPQTGMKPGAEPNPKVVKEKMSPAKAKSFAALAEPKDKITFADKIAGAKKEVDEMLGDVAAEAMKSALSGYSTKSLKAASSKDADADRKSGVSPQYSKQQVKDELKRRGEQVADEGSTGDYSAKKARAGKDIGKPGKAFAKIAKGAAARYGSEESGKRVAGAVLNKLRHKGANEGEMDEGFPTVAGARAELNKRKVGDVTHGAKHDVEEIPGGRRVTRRVDDKGYSVGSDTDDEGNAKSSEKRGRGRPKKADKAPERVTAKATKHKGGRKLTKEEIDEAIAALEGCGYQISKLDELSPGTIASYQKKAMPQAMDASNPKAGQRTAGVARTIGRKSGEELDEKAVSKAQQKFMGMVHATQKGEKAPSKEVAKVAKTMKKKDAEDFASTKHKGLPEKKAKKKEKTEEAGGTSTPTASSGFSYGKGIYDSMNRDLETMIKESMSRLDESLSINVSSSTEGGKNITVTASDDDAVKLAEILKNAGIGGGSEGYGGEGYKSSCGCDTPDCSCGDEELDENKPDWPTDEVKAQSNLEYSGGMNGPKSTGQTTVPVIAGQDGRTGTYAEQEEDAIKRMMEMAGISEAKGKKPDFLDVDKDSDKEESFKKAVKDKEEKKVEESILTATTNLWSEYKGKYGV